MTNTPDTSAVDTEGFLLLDYPSLACRPVPTFNLIIPPHWVVTEFPNALFVMGSSNGEDGSPVDEHWSNVVVHHERVLPEESLDTLAKSTGEALRNEIPTAVVKSESRLSFGDLEHFVREVEIPGASPAESLTRIDSYLLGPVYDHPTVDLFRITWIHPSAAGPERQALYMRILESLTFDE
jgi:hypothetical protein